MVLAEDHANFRRSLRLLLDHEQDMQVIAEASDLETAMRQVASKRPHVLVLDLPMPNGSSVETIQTLRTQAPNTEIVVITMHDSQKFADQAIKAGALGFVLKDTADTELPEALRRAADGQQYISPRVR